MSTRLYRDDKEYPMKRIILASQSEARKELLDWVVDGVEVVISGIDEREVEVIDPERYVGQLATLKALCVWEKLKKANDVVIVAADTMVVLEKENCKFELIGKPEGINGAREILTKLRGTEHIVLTGLTIVDGEKGKWRDMVVKSKVTFRKFSDQELNNYLSSRESLGKAGAYSIRGGAGDFVTQVVGSLTSVIGLPLVETGKLLEWAGIKLDKDVRTVLKEKLNVET
jgi:septum formation protein